MKITITKDEIRKALPGLSKIISFKNTMPFSSHVRFAANAGKVTAQATDIDQTATYTFTAASSDLDGQAFLPLAILKDIAKGDGTIVIEADKDAVTITHTVAGHTMELLSEGFDANEWPLQGSEISVSEAKGFLKAYRRMAAFASTDETRRVICGVCVDTQGKGDRNATLVATDGRRLCCCNSMKLPMLDGASVIIPATKFLLWTGLQDEAELGIETLKGSSRVCVKAGPWTYRVKAVDGAYPNWRQVIPNSENAAHRIMFTDPEVEAMRKLVPSFPGGEEITLECAGVSVSLYGHDKGEKGLTIPLTAGSTYEGPGCRVALNRKYLLDALNAGFRNFTFMDNGSPLLSDDGNGAKHVLMPMRVNPDVGGVGGVAQQTVTPKPAEASQPSQAAKPVPKQETSQQTKEKEMKQEKQTAPQTPVTTTEPLAPTALERAQAAYETAKAFFRDGQNSLAEMATALRDAVREDRQRKTDTEGIRAMLAKIQTMKV